MLGSLLEPDLRHMIAEQNWDELREALASLDPPDIAELLAALSREDKLAVFGVLERPVATEVFAQLSSEEAGTLLEALSDAQVGSIVGAMTPDDQARLLDELPPEHVRRMMNVLPAESLRSARDLLGYPSESAGRLMTPQFVSVTREMTAAQALEQIRRSKRPVETLSLVYVVDSAGKLVHEVRLGSLVLADPSTPCDQIDARPVVSVLATDDREDVVHTFAKYDRTALPVTDSAGYMLGIITVDDVMDAAEEENTEDMHKIGGMAALDTSYLRTPFGLMLRKRGGWLSALFLGEMLTATAMAHFEDEIAKAVVLAMFVPLVISSGGNSGSQASTLIIRSLALGELTLSDWWRVLRRELVSGLSLGIWLGLIGFVRVVLWQEVGLVDYGPHYGLLGITVWGSLVGVVTFGTLSGSMLPFILRTLGFDPATSSAPFVATLVDVTGLIIYFSVAWLVLTGTLL